MAVPVYIAPSVLALRYGIYVEFTPVYSKSICCALSVLSWEVGCAVVPIYEVWARATCCDSHH